jgi:CheY-like chemotaxis protein
MLIAAWQKNGAASMSNKPVVVVVDDEPPILDVVCDLLDDEGIPAIPCRESTSAFDTILQHEPRLVVLDVQMPGVDGIQLFQMLRSHPATRDIPILFLTANAQIVQNRVPDYKERGAQLLPKPFELSEFISSIHKLLDAQCKN